MLILLWSNLVLMYFVNSKTSLAVNFFKNGKQSLLTVNHIVSSTLFFTVNNEIELRKQKSLFHTVTVTFPVCYTKPFLSDYDTTLSNQSVYRYHQCQFKYCHLKELHIPTKVLQTNTVSKIPFLERILLLSHFIDFFP